MGRRGTMAVFCAAFAVYSASVYTGGTAMPGAAALNRQAQNGFALFQQKNCIACHQFYGLGGYMGPDLTNVMSAPGKGAEYARMFLEHGTDRMPDFNLRPGEIDDLLHFMKSVDVSGTYPPKTPRIRWNGTVIYDGGRD